MVALVVGFLSRDPPWLCAEGGLFLSGGVVLLSFSCRALRVRGWEGVVKRVGGDYGIRMLCRGVGGFWGWV